MKVAVIVHAEGLRHEAQYTLGTLLDATGFAHEFCASYPQESPGTLVLEYGAPETNRSGAVFIPVEDPTLWQQSEPGYTILNSTPALYVSDPPADLFIQAGERIILGFDIVQATFWLLSRREESDSSKHDGFSRFPCHESWLVKNGLAEMPIVNKYAELLKRALELAARLRDIPTLAIERWPAGRPYAVVLSHDVDDAGRFNPSQGLRLLARSLRQRSPRGVARGAHFFGMGLVRSVLRKPDPYWNFDAFMALERDAGFRSTFFFVSQADNVSRDPPYDVRTAAMRKLLTTLNDDGWEIGVHGSFDSYLNAETLSVQRQELERIVGSDVQGIRQHYLRLAIPDTFRAQVQAGFTYDATLGYRAAIGFRAGMALPFRPFDAAAGAPLPLLELPLTIMDGALFWQMNLSPDEATTRTLALLDTVRAHGGLAVLLWHQRVRYDKVYPGWWTVYRRSVEHLRDEALAWVATGRQVANWWRAREAVRLETIEVDGKEWRWRYRAGQPIVSLTLALSGANSGQFSVDGADCSVVQADDHTVRLELSALESGQAFTLVLNEAERA
jgi:hypothetical protein